MTPTQAIALANIAMKPTITKLDSLIVARRLARYFCENREAIHDERRLLHREAALLRQFEPFTKERADAMERQAKDYGADTLATIRNVLMELGQSLLHDSDGYMEALGFDAVCDLLNINTVEREQVGLRLVPIGLKRQHARRLPVSQGLQKIESSPNWLKTATRVD